MRVRISPSSLDGWDYFGNQLPGAPNLDEYIAQITGQSKPNAAMERGTRFHKALENYFTGPNKGEWDCDVELSPRHSINLLAPYKCEVKRGLLRNDTLLRGTIDAITNKPPVIIDYKTTQRGIDLDKYADSWQWRAYLTIWEEVNTFRYEVFQLREQGRNSGLWYVAEQEHLEIERYRGMEDEVWGKAEELAEFVRACHSGGKLDIDGEGRPVPLNKGTEE